MSSEHEPLPNRRWSVVALFDSRPQVVQSTSYPLFVKLRQSEQITVAFPFENDYESTEFTRLLSDYLKLHRQVAPLEVFKEFAKVHKKRCLVGPSVKELEEIQRVDCSIIKAK